MIIEIITLRVCVRLSVYPSVHPSVCVSPSVRPCVCVSVCVCMCVCGIFQEDKPFITTFLPSHELDLLKKNGDYP